MIEWSEGGLTVFKTEGRYVAVFGSNKTFVGRLLSFEPFVNSILKHSRGDKMLEIKNQSIKIHDGIRLRTEPPPKMDNEYVIGYSTHLRISRVYINDKRHILRWLWFNGAQKEFDNQVKIMQCLDHPNLEKITKVIQDNGNVQGIVTQHIDGSHPTEDTWTKSYSDKLMLIITHMHENGVVHNDICPNNIRICRHSGEIVLIDFDAATFEGKQDSWKWGNTKWHKRELYGTKEADIEAWRKMKEWSSLKE
ncbi:hypothetical protein GGH97_002709 [Coemansia sp. RSA 475]|nr:hypothetical protein GGH97_002709 [Coemansia sp. RSA 475]